MSGSFALSPSSPLSGNRDINEQKTGPNVSCNALTHIRGCVLERNEELVNGGSYVDPPFMFELERVGIEIIGSGGHIGEHCGKLKGSPGMCVDHKDGGATVVPHLWCKNKRCSTSYKYNLHTQVGKISDKLIATYKNEKRKGNYIPFQHYSINPDISWAVERVGAGLSGIDYMRSELLKAGKMAGIKGGFWFLHMFRLSSYGKEEYKKYKHKGGGLKKWAWLRSEDRLNMDHLNLSPHIHVVGFGYLNSERYRGWVVKKHNTGDNSKIAIDGVRGIVKYVLSHSCVVKRPTVWVRECSGSTTTYEKFLLTGERVGRLDTVGKKFKGADGVSRIKFKSVKKSLSSHHSCGIAHKSVKKIEEYTFEETCQCPHCEKKLRSLLSYEEVEKDGGKSDFKVSVDDGGNKIFDFGDWFVMPVVVRVYCDRLDPTITYRFEHRIFDLHNKGPPDK